MFSARRAKAQVGTGCEANETVQVSPAGRRSSFLSLGAARLEELTGLLAPAGRNWVLHNSNGSAGHLQPAPPPQGRRTKHPIRRRPLVVRLVHSNSERPPPMATSSPPPRTTTSRPPTVARRIPPPLAVQAVPAHPTRHLHIKQLRPDWLQYLPLLLQSRTVPLTGHRSRSSKCSHVQQPAQFLNLPAPRRRTPQSPAASAARSTFPLSGCVHPESHTRIRPVQHRRRPRSTRYRRLRVVDPNPQRNALIPLEQRVMPRVPRQLRLVLARPAELRPAIRQRPQQQRQPAASPRSESDPRTSRAAPEPPPASPPDGSPAAAASRASAAHDAPPTGSSPHTRSPEPAPRKSGEPGTANPPQEDARLPDAPGSPPPPPHTHPEPSPAALDHPNALPHPTASADTEPHPPSPPDPSPASATTSPRSRILPATRTSSAVNFMRPSSGARMVHPLCLPSCLGPHHAAQK